MKNETLKINAYAKVNLLLDVLAERPDGYHELEGIMQSISLADEVFLTPAEDIEVVCSEPLPEFNTCRTAAEEFLGESGLGVRIEVRKHIPSEAGLGGASADAAAVLSGLNRMFRGTAFERSRGELMTLGLRIGADVPFCLAGGCAIARGVGEELTPIKGLEMPLLIVKGRRGVSTGKLFRSLSMGPEIKSRLLENALDNALEAIAAGNSEALAKQVGNALHKPAEAIAPEIGEYCARMLESGALGASMTGSGAAVFGIFRSAAEANAASEVFCDCDFAEVCETIS